MTGHPAARVDGLQVVCPHCEPTTHKTPGEAAVAARVHRLTEAPRHRANTIEVY